MDSQSIPCVSTLHPWCWSCQRWPYWVEDNANTKMWIQFKKSSKILMFLVTSVSSSGEESHVCFYSFHCNLPLQVGIFSSSNLDIKKKIEIGWMPTRPCMLLCQRHDHNFMFFLKTSSKSNSIEKAFASKLSVLTLYLCASVLPMQIAWEITACFQGCSGMGMRGNGVLALFCTSNVTWRSGI